MNEMWTALERYQPYAERHGFGAEWRRMTTERTEEAAWRANDAVWFADGFWAAAAIEATVVAGAALAAVKAVRAVADAASAVARDARAAELAEQQKILDEIRQEQPR